MSQWSKEQLESMLEDVVNELDLSDNLVDIHGPLGTAPKQLVRIVLDRKDCEIKLLKAGLKDVRSDTMENGRTSYNSGYTSALWGELSRICPGTGKVENVNSVVVTEERLNAALKAVRHCA